MYSVPIQKMMEEYNLKLITENVDISEKLLVHPEVNRPALQLAGFYDYFDAARLQIIGLVEHAYLQGMKPDDRFKTIERLMAQKIPGMVVCRGLDVYPEMIEQAEKNDIPLFLSDNCTTDFMGDVIKWLRVQLAPRITMHGVLVDVYGEGILIMGESGIGKSETALELIKRGHRLVADDAVEIKRVSQQTLIGSCPEVLKYFIELRGIGIIDVRQMFGVESIKATQNIDLVIKLEIWEKGKFYDRFGLHEECIEILGNNVVCHSIPIRPGRNLAVICESAAINHRQKKMGYNAAKMLSERITKNIEEKSAESKNV